MSTKVITIGTDYARVLGGRFEKYGPFSGEAFREEVLVPALQQNEKVNVYLDGAATYMGSFLEEAFGGLIRKGYYRLEDLQKKLWIGAHSDTYAIYVRMAEQNMQNAVYDSDSASRVA